MNLITSVIISTCLLFSSLSAYAASLNVPEDRAIRVSGEIMDLRPQVLEMAMKFIEAPTQPIYIMLDTPGGLVDGGMPLINAIRMAKLSGAEVVCVAKYAASMGLAIFSECSKRYAMADSRLLWHPVKALVQDALSYEVAQGLAKELKEADDMVWATTKRELHISDELYMKHYREETMHTGAALKKMSPGYLHIVDKVEGAGFTIDDPIRDLSHQIQMPGLVPN
jgi:ATP-dependent protease ClpP protease subunit